MISIVFRYYTSEQALYRLLRLFFKKSERTHSATPPFGPVKIYAQNCLQAPAE